ncbi:P-loop containing nucleoside triphosphate hydrolase protein [Dipodascopsis tothii]|uniref:P-loop containing nucleoside triphosphate hydrolase protein n=1 Tax=Dipodascopsis tothii TaxID=44089 RepID=UPI0034CD336B
MSVDFSAVGGLDGHINQLKEMIMLPLLYPEIFMRFKVTPPRGVLFHGPPGTGKTLLARALASSCSSSGQKVSFYMRKGADALSKWVGEAERQLRLLFEEARNTQPSIIFFDEIDGLAPVRSSKQEQIHASIVSTLLALMDGMDNRGQVIVIGATNRPDSVDPALRRPGRFDREFYFPLPDLDARRRIVEIHTSKWEPPLEPAFVREVATLTKGYGGADLRALCTESALSAIQRRYPQIYNSNDKLVIDPTTIAVTPKDFILSLQKIVPSSARSTASAASALPARIEPLLGATLQAIVAALDKIIPRERKVSVAESALYEDDSWEFGFERERMLQDFAASKTFRPRLLVHARGGMGQEYLGAAILQHLEGFHVQTFDLATLLSDSTRTPEAAIVQFFVEVKRHKPSVVYVPNIDTWAQILSDSAKTTFTCLLRNTAPSEQILLLGVADCPQAELPADVRALFGPAAANSIAIPLPDLNARYKFFDGVREHLARPPSDYPDAARRLRVLEDLPKAPPAKAPPPNRAELKAQEQKDKRLKNYLKIKLSGLMDLLKVRYKRFRKPMIDEDLLLHLFDPALADPGAAPAYELCDDEMIRETATGRKYHNMDLDTVEDRLWNGYYSVPRQFLKDIEFILEDARTSGDRDRILRASEMFANVQVSVDEVGDQQFLVDCERMYAREQERHAEFKAKLERKQQELAEANALVEGAEPVDDKDVVMADEANGVAEPEPEPTPAPEPPVEEEPAAKTPPVEPTPNPPFVLDAVRVGDLHRDLADQTDGFTVEELEQLNSALLELVWKGKTLWDRTALVAEVVAAKDALLAQIRA